MSHDISCSLRVGVGRGTSYTGVWAFLPHKNFITLTSECSIPPVLFTAGACTHPQQAQRHGTLEQQAQVSEGLIHQKKKYMLHPHSSPQWGVIRLPMKARLYKIPVSEIFLNSHKPSYSWCLKFQM